MKLFILATVWVAASSSLAVADEVWTSTAGEAVVYNSETETTAVLQGPHGEWFYVENLAGNYDRRTGEFHGYWMVMAEDANAEDFDCASTRIAADGRASRYWGPLTLVFDSPAFPTGFTLERGFCSDLTGEYAGELVGTTDSTHFIPVTAAPK